MRLTYEVIGDEELRKAIKKLIRTRSREVRGETYAHGIALRQTAKNNLQDHGRWDLGNAANSIKLEMQKRGFTAKIEAEAPYSIYIENGARPHMPPVDKLEGWAKRHGFDSAWPIALAIAKRGIPATPFLGPAYDSESEKFYESLRKLVNK